MNFIYLGISRTFSVKVNCLSRVTLSLTLNPQIDIGVLTAMELTLVLRKQILLEKQARYVITDAQNMKVNSIKVMKCKLNYAYIFCKNAKIFFIIFYNFRSLTTRPDACSFGSRTILKLACKSH